MRTAPRERGDRLLVVLIITVLTFALTCVALTTTVAIAATPRQRLDALVRQRSASSTSVSVVDLTAGTTLRAGANSGMITASVAKLELLETLMMQRQAKHHALTATERRHVRPMIEQSSNTDADWVYTHVGGRNAVRTWENPLGLLRRFTVFGRHGHWGLTTTSATQQIILLRNLVDPHSPLTSANRAYALHLMHRVEADQRWGVPAVSTSGHPANKNGWLPVIRDHDRWAVNSIGVVTVAHHTLLVAVLTQHNASFPAGVARVVSLARAAVAARPATPKTAHAGS